MLREQALIANLIRNEEMKLAKFKLELKQLPKGTIYVRKKNNRTYFTQYTGKKQKGISKDNIKIYNLARKEYLKALTAEIGKLCSILEEALLKLSIINKCISEKAILKKYEMLNTDKILLTSDVFDWLNEDYEKNPYYEDELKYVTGRGVKMRSKSERFIGDKLEEYNIRYRYEGKIEIEGKTYYPDFIVLCEDGSLIIWEHFGLMDDNDYKIRAFNKINEYRKIGFKQHTNLICTYEEDLENAQVLEDIIERIILKTKVW